MHWRSVPLLTKHHLHSPARTRQRQPDRIAHIKHERWLPCCVADPLWPSLLERENCFSHLLCLLSIVSALERYRGDPKDICTRPECGHRASSFMRWKRRSEGIFMAVDSLRYLIHPRGLGSAHRRLRALGSLVDRKRSSSILGPGFQRRTFRSCRIAASVVLCTRARLR